MGLFRSLAGWVELELTSADLGYSLSAMTERGIHLSRVSVIGDLSARISVSRRDCRAVMKFARNRGDRVRILHRQGLYWSGKGLLVRPVLVLGLTLLVAAALYLPSRVLFVEVEGNETVSSGQILSAAADCGIDFGASRRQVRSEKVKNALLEKLPQLQWAGVNTRGCVAIISVRERHPESQIQESAVSSIVADRDGVILSVTVTDGTGQCAPGQAVRRGAVLISGMTDCGLCVTATRAQGEVMALTARDLTVKTPAEALQRGREGDRQVKYSLILGKKRINFYKGSGISDATCVKMYKEYCLTLPGGFALPVKLLRQQVIACRTEPSQVSEEAAARLLSEGAKAYLLRQMIAGSLTGAAEAVTEDRGAWVLAGRYACTEMIGRVRNEEIGVLP